MYPSTHLIIGTIVSLVIWIVFPNLIWWQAFIILISSIIIDVDHYLWYVLKKKDWSLKKSYQWHAKKGEMLHKLSEKERNEYKHLIMIFHGFEFWLILILLIFVNKIFLFVLIGIGIHMILDYIDLYRWKVPFYSKTSQIAVIVKNKNKNKVLI
ncbi:MAG: hypothetical protein ABIF88_03560 [archaeon]